MSTRRTFKVRLGVGASLAVGLFALTVAAGPAQAAGTTPSTSINQGGLVFTAQSSGGVTNSEIQNVTANGTVVVTGSADLTVTQTSVSSGAARATTIILGATGKPYTGTMTLDNVTLSPSPVTAVEGQSEDGGGTGTGIYYANTSANATGGNGNSGATVILTNGCKINSASIESSADAKTLESGATTTPAGAIVMAQSSSATEDQLVIQGGSEVIGGAGCAGISVGGTSKTGSAIITFSEGGGSVTGGNALTPSASEAASLSDLTNGTPINAIELAASSTGTLTINVNADATVTGGTDAAPGEDDGETTIPAGDGIAALASTITIQGESTLTVSGGDAEFEEPTVSTGLIKLQGEEAAAGTGNAGGDALTLGSAAGNITLKGPGVVNAQGGHGADFNQDSSVSAGGAGGNAVSLQNTTGGNSGNTLTVSGGTLNAVGGTGGSSTTAGAGEGGNGVDLGKNNLAITGGTTNLTGGPDGTGVAASEGNDEEVEVAAQTQGGYGINGDNGGGALTVSQGAKAGPAPSVTITGAKNGTGESAEYVQAISALGSSKGNGITITTPIAGNAGKNGNWEWVALTDTPTAQGALSGTPTLQGFAGMSSTNTTAMQQTLVNMPGGTTAATGSNVIAQVQILTAELQSLQASVESTSADVPNGYVVAQTSSTMNGNVPNATTGQDRVYKATLSATFAGLDNVNTSNFGSLAGIVLSDEQASITPANNVSTSGVEAPNFYVVPGASGNELTVTLDPSIALPKNVTDIYGADLAISSATVPVVYTVALANASGIGTQAPTAEQEDEPELLTSWNLYTSPSGDGTLVFGNIDSGDGAYPEASATATGEPTWPNAASAVAVTSLPTTATTQNVPATPAFNPPVVFALGAPAPSANTPNFIGWYNESGQTPEQVATSQVSEWSANTQLTAEWGQVVLISVLPSPINLTQGASDQVVATYQVVAANNKITTYNMLSAGVDTSWDVQFVDTNTGSGNPSSLTVKTTDSQTTGAGPTFTTTLTATVTASSEAALGSYRVWPVNGGGSGADQKYAVVQITQGNEPPAGEITVVRLYNPFTYEHLYTTDPVEVESLSDAGWDNEGEAWIAPQTSNRPIYRLFNRWNSDHMYTTSLNEYNTLIAAGWEGEGVKLYSAPQGSPQIYRLYNPYMTANGGAYSHLWTGDFGEYVKLGDEGWQQESVAWNAISVPLPPA